LKSQLFTSLWRICALAVMAATAGCALPARPVVAEAGLSESPWAVQSGRIEARGVIDAQPMRWQHIQFPGKVATDFSYARVDGRDTIAARSLSSASMLRHALRIEAADLGRVRFSWKVPELIADADLGLRDKSDSPVRIVLAFEGDRSKFSLRNAMLAELTRTLMGEDMPFATLMYVWCNHRAPGTVIANARTDRIQKIVVESGAGRLNQWLDYERDIRADYLKAFGEAPGALIGIGIMTDSDNTHSKAQAWYGPLHLTPLASR
jgi:hypothetical protein